MHSVPRLIHRQPHQVGVLHAILELRRCLQRDGAVGIRLHCKAVEEAMLKPRWVLL